MSKSLGEILDRKVDFVRNTPLDLFFSDLDVLFSKINKKDKSTSLYDDLELSNKELIKLLASKLRKLFELVKVRKDENKDILPISLHDMKHFDVLVSLLVVQGINANISIPIGLSTDERRLGSFKVSEKMFDKPKGHTANQESLQTALDAFSDVLLDRTENNYLKKLFLKGGAGFADTIIGFMSLFYSTADVAFEEKLMELEAIADTYSLFEIYTLIVSSTSKKEFQQWPVRRLSMLTIERSDGLLSLVDFVIGVREDEQIDTEKLSRVNQIVAAKPKGISSVQYFDKLFEQVYDGLVNVDKPILITCLNGIVATFFMKNKRIVRDFLFAKIYTILYNPKLEEFSAKELNDCINVLISLSRTTNIAVLEDLIGGFNNGHQFYLNLWIYALFLKTRKISSTDSNGESYYNIILGLIRTYMTVTNDFRMLNVLLLNLVNFEHELWKYEIDFETQLPCIKLTKDNIKNEIDICKEDRQTQSLEKFHELFANIDSAVDLFVTLLKRIDNPSITKNIFLATVNNWTIQRVPKKHLTRSELEDATNSENQLPDNIQALVQLKLMEGINENFKTDILSDPTDLLTVIHHLLQTFSEEIYSPRSIDSDDEDDEDDEDDKDIKYYSHSEYNEFSMVLRLLSSVLDVLLSDNNFTCRKVLEDIAKRLEIFKQDENCRQIIKKLNLALSSDLGIENNKTQTSLNTDRELLQKAISNLNDPIIPIRAHGLFELRQLIAKHSPVLECDRALLLHISQLNDQDPSIYLNVIRGLNALIQLAPNESLPTLFKLYRSRTTSSALDDILKIGEVLINYVTEQDKAFQGQIASQLIEICLENIRDKETVDNRLRMSSMSILGVCLQVNAAGIQRHIHDILDCVIHILSLERPNPSEDESLQKNSAIMRRSAIRLIYDLMIHSGLDLFPDTYTPSKIRTTLSYARSQEYDYFICEQIDKVLDELDKQIQTSLAT